MDSLPFGKPGHWYRGNLHTHSTNSDGKKAPREVCAYYRRRGYHFISLTDHFLESYGFPISDTTAYRSDGFTTIIGGELHAPKTSLGDDWHILAVGLPLDFKPPRARETGPQLAARAKAAGAYVAAAHPAWYDLTDTDILSLKAASALEVVNTSCMVHNGKGDSSGYLDRMLSQGRHYHAIATDDAHFNAERADAGQNWVMVRCKRLHPEALLEALHAGDFYASQGPEILSVKPARGGKKLSVRTSPVRAMRLTGRGASASYIDGTADITSAQLDLSAIKGPYARLTVFDKRGRRAWTNPISM